MWSLNPFFVRARHLSNFNTVFSFINYFFERYSECRAFQASSSLPGSSVPQLMIPRYFK